LISTGQPKKEFLDTAIRHVLMRQGVLGLKVQIMSDVRKEMPNGTIKLMPDVIDIHEPKDHRTEPQTPSVLTAGSGNMQQQ